jgi:hypothetical protein
MLETDDEEVQYLQHRLLLQRFVPGEEIWKPFVHVF